MRVRQENQIGPGLALGDLRELAGRRGHPVVTSIYLDVDGRRHPRPSELKPNVDHLLAVARHQAGALGRDAAAAVGADVDDLRRLLTEGFDRSTTRGIAVFSADARDHRGQLTACHLGVPVRDQVVVGPSPALSQLCEVLEANRPVLAVVVDRRQARFVRVALDGVVERPGPLDEPPRQVDTDVELGSFQPFLEEAASRHLRAVAEAVARELRAQPADHVVLGGPTEAVAELEAHLPPGVTELVVGRLGGPVTAGTAEIASAARAVLDGHRQRRVSAAVDELVGRAGRGKGGVAGLAATLELLGEGRVGTLVVAQGFTAAGGRCASCGRLVADESRCPRCGSSNIEPVDVLEAAVAEALAGGASVEVADPTAIEAMGVLGAFERFPAGR